MQFFNFVIIFISHFTNTKSPPNWKIILFRRLPGELPKGFE